MFIFKIHSNIYIRCLHLGPVHPATQVHTPGETHVPPLQQSSGHIAMSYYTNFTSVTQINYTIY